MKKYILFVAVSCISRYPSIVCMEILPPLHPLHNAEIKKMIEASCNKDRGAHELFRDAYGRNDQGKHIIDVRKEFERIQRGARTILPERHCIPSGCVSLELKKVKITKEHSIIKKSIRRCIRHYK